MNGHGWIAQPQALELRNGKWYARLVLRRDDHKGIDETIEELDGEFDSKELAMAAAMREIERRTSDR